MIDRRLALQTALSAVAAVMAGRTLDAYVARGTIVSQLGAAPPATYAEGEMWYESPGTTHSITRNASELEPAKLVASFVADDKPVLTEPI